MSHMEASCVSKEANKPLEIKPVSEKQYVQVYPRYLHKMSQESTAFRKIDGRGNTLEHKRKRHLGAKVNTWEMSKPESNQCQIQARTIQDYSELGPDSSWELVPRTGGFGTSKMKRLFKQIENTCFPPSTIQNKLLKIMDAILFKTPLQYMTDLADSK